MGQTCSCPCWAPPPAYELHESTNVGVKVSAASETMKEIPESTEDWTRYPCPGGYLLRRTIYHQGSIWHQRGIQMSNDRSLDVPPQQSFTCKMTIRPGYNDKDVS